MKNNQQQTSNYKIIWKGKSIKPEHYQKLIEDYNNKFSISELSRIYNYSFSSIRNFLFKNKVKLRNLKESMEKFFYKNPIAIDNFLEENIIGWLLGDGSLRIPKHGKNPYFSYTDKHIEYITYVENVLKKYNLKTRIEFSSNSRCYRVITEARSEFMKYYNLFYGYKGLNSRGQKRKILPDIIITPIILKNWYIGDGSSSKHKIGYNHRGMIYDKYKNDFILKQLNNICGNVKCYHCGKSNPIYQYYFNNKAFIKLLNYIGECPVKCYKYKWITRCSTTK